MLSYVNRKASPGIAGFDSKAELLALVDADSADAERLAMALRRIQRATRIGRHALGRVWRQPDLYRVAAGQYAIFCVGKPTEPGVVHIILTARIGGVRSLNPILDAIAERRHHHGV